MGLALVALMIISMLVVLWMSINNWRDSMGKPKMHLHRYSLRFDNLYLEECVVRRCHKTRLREPF